MACPYCKNPHCEYADETCPECGALDYNETYGCDYCGYDAFDDDACIDDDNEDWW